VNGLPLGVLEAVVIIDCDDTAFVGKDYNQDTFIAHDDRMDALDNGMGSLDEAQNMEDITV
jgi:hypothetical protein